MSATTHLIITIIIWKKNIFCMQDTHWIQFTLVHDLGILELEWTQR